MSDNNLRTGRSFYTDNNTTSSSQKPSTSISCRHFSTTLRLFTRTADDKTVTTDVTQALPTRIISKRQRQTQTNKCPRERERGAVLTHRRPYRTYWLSTDSVLQTVYRAQHAASSQCKPRLHDEKQQQAALHCSRGPFVRQCGLRVRYQHSILCSSSSLPNNTGRPAAWCW